MALNFPSTPATNDTFSSGGITWTYNGSSWTTTRTGAAFDSLSDVDLTGAANNDLIYRSAGTWVDTGGQLTWDGSTFLATAGTVAGASVVALSNTLEVQGTFPFLQLNQTDGATNEKKWNWIYDGTSLEMRAVNDASNAYSQAFVMTRSGYAISALTFGNATDNPTFTFSGTGLTTVGGALTVVGVIDTKAGTQGAPSITFGGDTTTGIYKAGTNTIGFTTGGTQRLIIDSSGISSGVAKMYLPGGSAGAPTYSFLSDSNSGMYGNNAGSVYIVSDATARLTVDSSGITVNGTASAASLVATSNTIEAQGAFPYLQLNQTDGGTDEKKWNWLADGTTLGIRLYNDASSAYNTAFTITRSGYTVSNLEFGNATNNPTYTFAGTGAISGVGSGLTSLTAANISSGNLGSGVLPYTTASSSNSNFQVPFLNTTGTSSGNFGLLLDSASPMLYNPSSGVLTVTILDAGNLYVDNKLVLNLPSNSADRGPWNPIATAIIQSGRRLHNDPEFKNGANSISVYDNGATGQVSVTHGTAASLDAGFAAPNSTGNIVEIVWTGSGAPEPNDGGWVQSFTSEENHTFAQVILAKLPSGSTISLHENSQGTGATSYWLTNTAGTGKYEYYIRVSHCGDSGSFSTSGYVAIDNGGSAWAAQVAFQATYDITEHPDLYTTNGGTIRVYDSTGSDYLQISHDGTDVNFVGTNTTDINITGITSIIHGGPISATSFSGSGASLTSLTAANISSGNLGSGVLPYVSSVITNSDFQVALVNTTGTSSGNYGLLMDGVTPPTYNPSAGVFFASVQRMGNGSTSVPSLAFSGDPDTGWYQPTSGVISMVINGDVVASWVATASGGLSVDDEGGTSYNVGWRDLPQNSRTSSYTLALSDRGKHISITTGGITIPANSSVAFPTGAAVTIFNNSGSTQTVAITTDTLRQAGTANTGTRTLAAYGVCTVLKVASTTWVISGNVT